MHPLFFQTISCEKDIPSLIHYITWGIIIFISCTKEKFCEECRDGNKPPTAIAGPDQVITLPTDSISLDGSSSSDPDGKISEWLRIKISGPASLYGKYKRVGFKISCGFYFSKKIGSGKGRSG